ncbi:MAG: hypothetical protein ACOY93_08455 [Bacillota bacterium]
MPAPKWTDPAAARAAVLTALERDGIPLAEAMARCRRRWFTDHGLEALLRHYHRSPVLMWLSLFPDQPWTLADLMAAENARPKSALVRSLIRLTTGYRIGEDPASPAQADALGEMPAAVRMYPAPRRKPRGFWQDANVCRAVLEYLWAQEGWTTEILPRRFTTFWIHQQRLGGVLRYGGTPLEILAALYPGMGLSRGLPARQLWHLPERWEDPRPGCLFCEEPAADGSRCCASHLAEHQAYRPVTGGRYEHVEQ